MSRVLKKSNLDLRGAIPVKSIDIIGDIAILKMPEAPSRESRLAEALLTEAPYVKVVYRQTGPVTGDYRLRELKWLAGEKRSSTIHKEHGCKIEVDVVKDYFSPRLAYERSRIARLVKIEELTRDAGEVIINMFAGVGSFSLRIAKETKLSKIYSIDINPDAFLRMFRNVLINKMLGRIACICGEAGQMIDQTMRSRGDRILMPLPERSFEYLECALGALKEEGGVIHFQSFVHAGKCEDPVDVSKAQLCAAFRKCPRKAVIGDSGVIRSIGPRWYQVATDLRIVPSNEGKTL